MESTLSLDAKIIVSLFTTWRGESKHHHAFNFLVGKSTLTIRSAMVLIWFGSHITTRRSFVLANETTTVSTNFSIRIIELTKNLVRIMYWSLHDNNILCSFVGHTDQITHLDLNPLNSTFVSCSKDGSTRVWEYEKK